MFVSIGLFIVDQLANAGSDGQIGGGGIYAAIGARIWLPPSSVGAIIDKGRDFPLHMHQKLVSYGPMWLFREHDGETNRALISYHGETQLLLHLLVVLPIPDRVSTASSTSHHASTSTRGICAAPVSPTPRPCMSFALRNAPSRSSPRWTGTPSSSTSPSPSVSPLCASCSPTRCRPVQMCPRGITLPCHRHGCHQRAKVPASHSLPSRGLTSTAPTPERRLAFSL